MSALPHNKSLSERDICTKFITPNLEAAGWDIKSQVREEVSFTDGRIYVLRRIHARGEKKHARTHAVHHLQAVLKEAFAPAA